MSIFFDVSGNIKPTLLCEDAEKVAGSLVKIFQGKVDGKNSITSAQLRRFYGEFKSLEKKFQFRQGTGKSEREKAFLYVLPLIKMEKSKVAYAAKKVPYDFKKWMNDNVDAIATPEDFEAFLLHFEAVVGFCYGLGISD